MSTNRPAKVRNIILVSVGTLSTGIGIVGIFVPVLPTTPFLLLAAACYLRSSERLYRRLMNNKVLGTYICNYVEGKGMAAKAKVITLFLLWLSIGLTMSLGTDSAAVRVVLGVVAAGVTTHIVMVKPRHKETLTTGEVFDGIAPGWYNFRHRSIFPGEMKEMVGKWRSGRLLNVGCAHGPDFPAFREGFELHGIDISGRMLGLAKKYAGKNAYTVELAQADARRLPYADGSFDYAVAAATYHHIQGKEERLEVFRELKRVLKPGGEAFITVWNRWQPRFWLKNNDMWVPWKTKERTYYRYYHLFSRGELEKTLRKAGLEVVDMFPEKRYRFPLKCFSRNICALVTKPVFTPPSPPTTSFHP